MSQEHSLARKGKRAARRKRSPLTDEERRRILQSWRLQEFILLKEAAVITRLSSTTIWRLQQKNKMPRFFPIGQRLKACRGSDFRQYVDGTWQPEAA
jgi:predicted DNA-binding transcriptional regulator AlpA